MEKMGRRDFLMASGALAVSTLLGRACKPGSQDRQHRPHMSTMPPLTDLHRHLEAGFSPETIATLAKSTAF